MVMFHYYPVRGIKFNAIEPGKFSAMDQPKKSVKIKATEVPLHENLELDEVARSDFKRQR